MAWTCPECGPLRGTPLHGADEEYHCVNLGCDAVCHWESEVTLEPRGWRVEQERSKARLAAKVSGGGQPTMALKQGKCGRCKTRKTLLKSTGPSDQHRCHACHSAEKRGESAPKTKRKAKSAQARRREEAYVLPERDDEDEPDQLTLEITAMRVCAEALEKLDPEGLRRVLTFLGDRLDRPAMVQPQRALPGPTPTPVKAELVDDEEDEPEAAPAQRVTTPRFAHRDSNGGDTW